MTPTAPVRLPPKKMPIAVPVLLSKSCSAELNDVNRKPPLMPKPNPCWFWPRRLCCRRG